MGSLLVRKFSSVECALQPWPKEAIRCQTKGCDIPHLGLAEGDACAFEMTNTTSYTAKGLLSMLRTISQAYILEFYTVRRDVIANLRLRWMATSLTIITFLRVCIAGDGANVACA
jgi:hypothetical protein